MLFPNKTELLAHNILTDGMSAYLIKLETPGIKKILLGFAKDAAGSHGRVKNSGDLQQTICLNLISFLKKQVEQLFSDITQLNNDFNTYTLRISRAQSLLERQQHILDFSKLLGANRIQLKGDKKAFKRWFGHDAMVDRYRQKLAELEKFQSLLLERLGVVCKNYLSGRYSDTSDSSKSTEKELDLSIWQKLELEQAILPGFVYTGDGRVKISAFKCLSVAISETPQGYLNKLVSENSVQFIYRASLDHRLETWIQTEAMALLMRLSPDDFITVFRQRFENIGDHNDIFIRFQAVKLMGEFLVHNEAQELLQIVLDDKSPYVRQALSEILPTSSFNSMVLLLPQLLYEEKAVEVRAACILKFNALISTFSNADFLEYIVKILKKDNDELVIRTLLSTIPDLISTILNLKGREQANRWIDSIMTELTHLYPHIENIKIRRWIAKTREWLWCYSSEDRISFFNLLNQQVDRHAEKGVIKKPDIQLIEEDIARLFSLLSQNNFGFDIKVSKRKIRYFKKPYFVFRFWRFFHELRTPSTEKRQAHSHTIGRLNRSRLIIPSHILSELSETKVPGEPLYIAEEDGWRNYLPLVDDIISLMDPLILAPPIKIVTSDGITQLFPPLSPIKRMAGLFVVTNRFHYFSQLRNYQKGSSLESNSYIHALKQLGIKCEYTAHSYPVREWQYTDPHVEKFFTPLIPLPLMEWFDGFRNYFYSVYENSLTDLLLFLGLLGSFFVGRHAYLNSKIRAARKSVNLVIGGWGTRGKSGTERLKAAVLNALGYSIVSKTTGCEAMFLYAHQYGDLREMFLFRPYDKATIWEQSYVLQLAHKLKSGIFLWECMGLTPSFIDILQRQWMRDDIATITNTYPDHEDLQGPAGYNIPIVMTQFIPEDSTLVTTEEQMLPILKLAAEKRRSDFHSVGWQDAGLLTEDVLKRFPYDEHPYNVALVLKMVDILGVDKNFALKEMADRVVPDLGVLKTYPTAKVKYRMLTFVMGMSANERFGAMGNWVRTGFDQFSLSSNPDIWVTALVNNRADRIARSRVFADIVVKDISYDRLILIGTNLRGLKGYIEESWEQHKQTLNLWHKDESVLDVFNTMARRFRIPCSKRELCARIEAMLRGVVTHLQFDDKSEDYDLENLIKSTDEGNLIQLLNDYLTPSDQDRFLIEEMASFIHRERVLYQQYSDFSEKIKNDPSGQDSNLDKEQLDQEFKHLVWDWIAEKIVIIEDEYADGNEVISHIVEQTPPGMHNQIMGMQNIKGTGLDYVYKWLAWDSCQKSILKLKNEKNKIARVALKELASFQDFNILCSASVEEAISYLHTQQWTQKESIQAEINLLQENFNHNGQFLVNTEQQIPQKGSFIMARILEVLEFILDANDAVKRRKKADLIYKDLISKRISNDKAAIELQLLNKRQKGGWLRNKFLN